MSSLIHHGAPGAYKTSGAVQDNLIPWALQGRTVVTNVRGLETKHFRRTYNKQALTLWRRLVLKHGSSLCDRLPKLRKFAQPKLVPASFEIISVDTDTRDGRRKMQRWFMWAPKKCAFLIDEVQKIYPQKWTATDYKKLCYDDIEEARIAERPEDVYIAFEMHRHHGWDFVVTAPNIKKVPDIVRQISEVAYYHDNRAKVGVKGRYVEAMHDPADAGNKKGMWVSSSIKVQPKRAFELYQSTAIGEVKDTEAGINVFLKPVPIFTVVFMALTASVLAAQGNPLAPNTQHFQEAKKIEEAVEAKQQTNQTPTIEVPKMVDPAGAVFIPNSSTRSFVSGGTGGSQDSSSDFGYLTDFDLFIGGVLEHAIVYARSIKGQGEIELRSPELTRLGYRLQIASDCMWILKYKQVDRVIMCRNNSDDKPRGILGSVGSSDFF